jgi:hypothetical protein
MNSLTTLLLEVLADAGTSCGIDTKQDSKTILRRVEKEGESFMTITLPSVVKDLYKALDQGAVSLEHFPAFKRKRGEVIPLFMGEFFGTIFDPASGEIHSAYADSSLELDMVRAIRAIVQVTGLHGKLFEQAPPKRTAYALDRYVENDGRVMVADLFRGSRLRKLGSSERELRTAIHVLFGGPFGRAQARIRSEDLRPKHGPGSVADRLFGNEKWQQPAWPERLEDVFPYGKWNFNTWLNFLEEVDSGNVSDPGPEIPVRVITVPKTQKTPRIIAIEPTHMQYMQQAVKDVLEEELFSDKLANSMMGYKSQVPNQDLALEGSITHDLATLDLSDASDLVSCQLVNYLFRDWPDLRRAIMATRSTHADVLGEVIHLHKFASMGSALCFPIEAIVFSAIVLVGIRRSLHPYRSLRWVARHYEGMVRVYGDDIIVPTGAAQSVVDHLEASGLKVNRDKSFWTGGFRESCGKEYWHGHDVTYVKVRFRLPTPHKPVSENAESIAHTVALRNNFAKAMIFNGSVVEYLDSILREALHGVYPMVASTSPALGWHGPFGLYETQRTDNDTQTPMVKAYTIVAKPPASKLDGNAALMKCLVNDSELPIQDPEHLLRAGRPAALHIKQRWLKSI